MRENHKNLVNDFICSNIRRIRLERGYRIRDMAERSGIPLGSYSCLETGRYRMSIENLYRILEVLGAGVCEVWPSTGNGPTAFVDTKYIHEKIREAERARPPQLTIAEVLDAVSRVYRVGFDQMASASRRRELSEARTVAALLVREQRHLSLVSLGRELNRDVSSLSHCVKRMSVRIQQDQSLGKRIGRARRYLESL